MVERLGARGVRMEMIDFERLAKNGKLCSKNQTMNQDQFHKVISPFFS
jgi:hypothetical protein